MQAFFRPGVVSRIDGTIQVAWLNNKQSELNMSKEIFIALYSLTPLIPSKLKTQIRDVLTIFTIMLILSSQLLSSLLFLVTFFVPALAKCYPDFTEKGGDNGFGNTYKVGHNRKVVDHKLLNGGGYIFTQKEFPKVNGTLTTIYYRDDITFNPMVEFHLEIENKDTKRRTLQLAFFDKLEKGPYWLFTISAQPKKIYAECRFAASFYAADILTMQVF